MINWISGKNARLLRSSAIALGIMVSALSAKDLTLSVIDEPIRVDGILDEKVYQDRSWNEGLQPILGDVNEIQQTRFMVFADSQYLYLSILAEEKSQRLSVPDRRADGVMGTYVVERNDSIAFTLSVNEDRSEFVRYLLNPGGVVLKVVYAQDGFLQQTVESDARVAVKVVPGESWSMELAIPLVELGVVTEYKDWLFQLMRTRRERSHDPTRQKWERSLWTNSKSPDDVRGFAKLNAGDLELERYAWQVGSKDGKVVKREGRYFFSDVVAVQNRTGKSRKVTLRSQIGAGAVGSVDLELGQDQAEQMQLLFDLGEQLPKAKVEVRHELYMNSDTKTPHHGMVAVSLDRKFLKYEPVRFILSKPGYRGTIYHTQKIEEIVGKAILVDEGLGSEELSIQLTDSKGQVFAGELTRLSDSEWGLRVPGVAQMAEGKLQLTLSGGTGVQAWQHHRSIRKVPYQKGEIWIDEQGIVYRDGKPFPVYGFLFGHWRELEQRRVPGMEFNAAGPLWIGMNHKGLVGLINDLSKQGVYSGVYAPTGTTNDRNLAGKTSLTASQREEYRKLARFFKNQEQVIYYYLYDEPEGTGGGGVDPAILREIYDILVEEDPYRPVVILNHTVRGVWDYQFGSDISNPDVYPVFLEGAGSASSMSRTATYLEHIVTGEDSYRAKWITPQAFDWTYFGAELGRRGPNVREMRTQQLMGLIHGAVAVTWYPEYLVWDEIGVFTSLPYLSREYQFLFPYLIENRPEVLQRGSSGSVGLTGTEGNWILMITNTQWDERTVRVTDPRLASVKKWNRWGTSESVAGGTDTLEVRLQPHESMILGSSEIVWPKDLNWIEVEKAEIRTRQEAVIPGNLAHKSLGVKAVNYNIAGRAQVKPMYMIDGIKDPRSIGFYHRGFESDSGAEIIFPAPLRASRLVLLGSTITQGVIQLEINGQWVNQAVIGDNSEQFERVYDLGGKEFSRIRIVAQKVRSNNLLIIREVEVYE